MRESLLPSLELADLSTPRMDRIKRLFEPSQAYAPIDTIPDRNEEDEDDIEAHEASVQRLKVSLLFLLHAYHFSPTPHRKLTKPPVK